MENDKATSTAQEIYKNFTAICIDTEINKAIYSMQGDAVEKKMYQDLFELYLIEHNGINNILHSGLHEEPQENINNIRGTRTVNKHLAEQERAKKILLAFEEMPRENLIKSLQEKNIDIEPILSSSVHVEALGVEQEQSILLSPLDAKLKEIREKCPTLEAALKDIKEINNEGLANDILILHGYYEKKMKEPVPSEDKTDYENSLSNFYKESLSIRLSQATHAEQVKQLEEAAHKHFTPRHFKRRFCADVFVVLSSLCIVGLAIMLSHKLFTRSHTFFFSNAKTNREIDFKKLLIKGESQRLLG